MIAPGRRRKDFADPATLMRIKALELRAKTVVEGFWNGLNRSPFHGFSVEFTEYREYTPGDDPRHLDWKLYARSDRYYVKRFEDETNLACHLLLDASRSMDFGSLGYSKFEYARTLAATLAWFLNTQRDAVGLLRFDETVDEFVPARFRPGQMRALTVALERPPRGNDTRLAPPLERVAEQITRRGMLVLISDLLAPVEDLEQRLGYVCSRGHEVLVFHVLDPAEVNFDFDAAAQFEDLETGARVYSNPDQVREQYLARFGAHVEAAKAACERHGAAYRRFETDVPLEHALVELLHSRKSASRPRPRRRTNRSAS